jgi:opacity protein-like surface antigen
LVLTAVAAALPAVVNAQVAMGVKPLRLGAQANFATDGSTFGLGARGEYSLATMVPSLTDFRFVGSFDFFFPDAGSYFELNAGVATSFSMPTAPVTPYAGAGLNIARSSIDFGGTIGTRSNTDVGLNVFGGVRFKPMGTLIPFAEARIELGGGENFVISGGLLFF